LHYRDDFLNTLSRLSMRVIALEIGIEPTVRQSLDLDYPPIVVTDACGSKNAGAEGAFPATLKDTGEVMTSTTAEKLSAMQQ
jgi:nicotinamidase-related amidase